MPVVYRQDGFNVQIWPNDHSPPHVHVIKADGVAVIEIDTLTVRRNEGMDRRNLSRALDIVAGLQELLSAKWKELHG